MGDEIRRTQRGNNNAYCQDNELSWFDWTLVEKHADLHRFVALLAARRQLRPVESELQRETLSQLLREAKKACHGVKLNQPDWADWSRSIAISLEVPEQNRLLYFIFNAYWEPLEFELPPVNGDGAAPGWHRWIDTFLESPRDILPWGLAPLVSGHTYRAEARSVVVLFANLDTS